MGRALQRFLSQSGIALISTFAAIIAYLALEVYSRRRVTHMLSHSVRPALPPFWVRGMDGENAPQCMAMRGDPTPDPKAFPYSDELASRVQITKFCEDVKIDTTLDVALLACDPGRAEWDIVFGPAKSPEYRGALWFLDYQASNSPTPQLLPIDDFPDDRSFHPLGINVHATSQDTARIFVVNNAAVVSTIEVFDMDRTDDGWRGRFVRTIFTPVGTYGADAVWPIDANRILVSNMHVYFHRVSPYDATVEMVRGVFGSWAARWFERNHVDGQFPSYVSFSEDLIGSGWVSHIAFDDEIAAHDGYDWRAAEAGTETELVVSGIKFANGIQLTPDKKHLVLGETGMAAVLLYPVLSENPTWERAERLGKALVLPVPFLADNVFLTPPQNDADVLPEDPLQGYSILTAGHPSALDMEESLKGNGTAPSWVVQIYYDPAQPKDQAPAPANELGFTPAHNFTVQSLLITKGANTPDAPSVASSSGVSWDPTYRGRGTFMVAGLYSDDPLICRGMHT
ncbi:hypothetical protein MVES1_003949 [Malassezia vespertilionis]|uniref:Uncharacterized protein n=1 Tax=Malassezia vespertilionis TaxID=2020962 RepID=A0A2N1J7W1_9BASI|nr:uncharacterized protein MVES1_003949 [Malassezia vespertilionis]PKI82644.1 hypothetical protein MVES_003503 [Malassezia vespertilionis]WFD08573.1 hypothetical protein MVES1_003949 [Malassezia vespertilionis]